MISCLLQVSVICYGLVFIFTNVTLFCMCIRLHLFLELLSTMNFFMVFEFSSKFCFMPYFQNVSAPKIRTLVLQRRLGILVYSVYRYITKK